ncbi:glycosyltransferase 87 family protein [Phaeovulum sp.]|uniref:glycosyltransferase 87 family protein n=1 Tax=Phaeovulum sp. TaxID=2934796 RepID=UPI0039E4E033
MVLVALAAIAAFGFGQTGSNDLRAVWTAAQEVALGNPQLVYPSPGPLFTMRPPDEWLAHLRAAGHQGDIYPYIYPPLWAWLLAPVTENISFDAIVLFMRFLNGAALVGGLFIARHLCLPGATDHQRLTFFSVGFAGLLLTHSGVVALYENQPQILVGFLTLLGIERSENGHPAFGGAALALAAALKGYPALLAVFWIQPGNGWRWHLSCSSV